MQHNKLLGLKVDNKDKEDIKTSRSYSLLSERDL